MLENVLKIRLKRPCPDQIEPFQSAQTLVALATEICDPLEYIVEKSPSNDRCFLKNTLHLPFQAVKPRRKNPMDR